MESIKDGSYRHRFIHCRSRYSLLNGVLSHEEICAAAGAAGEQCVGFTDINNLYGLPAFLEAAAAGGLKALCGAVITLPSVNEAGRYLFTAYCTGREGFHRLNRLITAVRHAETRMREGGLSFDPVQDLVEGGWNGLFVLSSDIQVLSRLRVRGKDGLYAALFCGLPFRETVRDAGKLGIGSAALAEVLVINQRHRDTLAVLRAVGAGKPVARIAGRTDMSSPLSAGAGITAGLPAPGEMEAFFSAVPEALKNTELIAAQCAGADILPRSWVFPCFEGLNDEQSSAKLGALCREGIYRRYGKAAADGSDGPLSRRIRERLEYEMNIICRKGFAGYFLVVQDIVSQAPRTCGRGSAASSIVSYLLGITHVDPLRYNLFFERFLNMDRRDPPDIDVDFPWDERQKALDYVFRRYPGSSAMVADHVCFRRRGAAREAAKAKGLTDARTDEIMKKWRGGRGEPLPAEIAETAALIRGFPRHIGTHPGGVVITPGPITAFTHIQQSASGVPVIAWEKDGAEECGLVKIDLLGNRSLAVLRDTIRLANRRRSNKIEWESFQPCSDVRTGNYIETGDTAGIFYIESPATRQLLKKMGCADYEHLVAASSIIRPAANRWINEYVRRLKGGEYQPPHPVLEGVLDETYGIMVYQEDVARVAIAAAGFSPGDADQLRKTLSKKNRAEKLPAWKQRFIAGTALRGLGAKEAEELWKGILSFDGYSFCKSHSASYALVSYRLAWLKLRYPLEFLCSVINNGGGFYARQVYINMVRRAGFPVLKPDINLSSEAYTIEQIRTGISGLRAGLHQVRELSAAFVSRVLKNRPQGGYSGFESLIRNTEPSYRELRMLIKSGCVDSLSAGLNRPQLFWKYYHMNRRQEASNSFFDESEVPELTAYSSSVLLSDELDTLELFFSAHPADYFTGRAGSFDGIMIDSRDIKRCRGRTVSIVGTIAAEKEVLTSAKAPMSFVSFEDAYSIFETVFFPGAWEAYEPELARGFAFLITGRVEIDMGAEYINISGLRCLNRVNVLNRLKPVS